MASFTMKHALLRSRQSSRARSVGDFAMRNLIWPQIFLTMGNGAAPHDRNSPINSSRRRVASGVWLRQHGHRYRACRRQARRRKLPRRTKYAGPAGKPLVLPHGPRQPKEVLVFADRRSSNSRTGGTGTARNRCHREKANAKYCARPVRVRTTGTSTGRGAAPRFGREAKQRGQASRPAGVGQAAWPEPPSPARAGQMAWPDPPSLAGTGQVAWPEPLSLAGTGQVAWPDPPPAARADKVAWPAPPSPGSGVNGASGENAPKDRARQTQEVPATASISAQGARNDLGADKLLAQPNPSGSSQGEMRVGLLLVFAIGLILAGIFVRWIVRMTLTRRPTVHLDRREPVWATSNASQGTISATQHPGLDWVDIDRLDDEVKEALPKLLRALNLQAEMSQAPSRPR